MERIIIKKLKIDVGILRGNCMYTKKECIFLYLNPEKKLLLIAFLCTYLKYYITKIGQFLILFLDIPENPTHQIYKKGT